MPEGVTYDVVIAGGGLAGLSAAILLASQGFAVAVLEKDDYPRHKVCGEYISNESRTFLLRLGLPLEAMNLPEIKQLEVSAPDGKLVRARLSQGGFGISRFLLDHSLAQLARDNGVQVLTDTKVTGWERTPTGYDVHTSGGTVLEARVVCAAWGKRSNLDVKAARSFVGKAVRGVDNYIAVKYHVRYPWPEQVIALHNFDHGYCGISRVEDDTCCLCYLTTAANLRRAGGSIRDMERNILRCNPHLNKIFMQAEFLYREPLTISQISFRPKEQVLDGVLMLGDTAGLITPLCGNGMSMAFHSATLAAACLDPFLKGAMSREEMERQYQRQWDRRFKRRLDAGRAIQKMFGDVRLTGFFLGVLRMLPFLKQPLIRMTHGKTF